MAKSKQFQFIEGFADATGLNHVEASMQWAKFISGLPLATIRWIESHGYDRGLHEGCRFNDIRREEEENE